MAGANGNKRNSNARRRVRKLSPREQLELKKKLRKKEKKSVIIKRAITAAFLTMLILVLLVGVYLIIMILYRQANQVLMKL